MSSTSGVLVKSKGVLWITGVLSVSLTADVTLATVVVVVAGAEVVVRVGKLNNVSRLAFVNESPNDGTYW
jgi:hypothetical protein